MDVIDDRGYAFILYVASLQWRSMKLAYQGSIEFIPDHGSVTHGEFIKNSSSPTIDNGQLSWISNGHSFNWKSLDEPLRETLLANGNGSVVWNCVQPKALCEINGRNFNSNGYGYTEKIDLEIAPWNLPIHELLWGRYLSKEHSIIWICWRGPEPRAIVYHNGEKIQTPEFLADQISWNEYTLSVPNDVMRNDTIGQSVFGKFKDIMNLFPKKIMGLEEKKMCGTGTLMINSLVIDHGSVIHEIVKWK